MPDGLQLLDLPQANIAEIQSGQFAYIVTPDGIPYRVDIADMTAKMNEVNGCVCIKTKKLTLTPAEVQALDATPIDFGITVPSGYYAKPLSADLFMTFNSAAYISLSPIFIYSNGSGGNIFTLAANVIDSVANIAVQFSPVAGAAGDEQMFEASSFSIATAGAITTGDSPIVIYMTYLEIEL